MSKYEDIIHQERPVSTHRPMSKMNRAAQFAPFAALNGHAEAIENSACYKKERMDLSEDQLQKLNDCLIRIQNNLKRKVEVVYYVLNEQFPLGTYQIIEGQIKRIDEVARWIFMEDGTEIPMRDVVEIAEKE